MPTMARSSAALVRACCFVMFMWSSNVSVICLPMLSTGFREVMGSWKIIPMRFPRTDLMRDMEMSSRSSPSKSTLPATILPGGLATRRIIDRACTLLPHPLSPTMPTISPSSRL